jgi:hypothetical protein
MRTKTNLLNTFSVLIMAAAIMMMAISSAQAASGDVKVDVTVHPITMLYYYDSVSVDIPGSVLTQLLTGGSTTGAIDRFGTTGTATYNGGVLDTTLTAPDSSLSVALNSVQLNLINSWSVRALGSTTTVSIALNPAAGANTLTNGTSSIVVTAATPNPASFTPSMSTVTNGDVRLTLNISNVNAIGNYVNSSGTFQYTITANTV